MYTDQSKKYNLFWVATCDPPDAPENGSVGDCIGKKNGEKCTIKCNEGFTGENHENLVCEVKTDESGQETVSIDTENVKCTGMSLFILSNGVWDK